jgi:hypothetical protein
MLDSGLLIGAPRLRILDVDYTTVLRTLYLPYPDKEGGVVLSETPAKAIKQTLLNGAVRYIQGGVRHNLTLTWGLYDPTFLARQTGKTIGTADNQIPELTPLYDLLSQYNDGRLSISPCSNLEIWYRVACTSDLVRQGIYPAGFGNVSLTLEGLDVFSDSSATSVIG